MQSKLEKADIVFFVQNFLPLLKKLEEYRL